FPPGALSLSPRIVRIGLRVGLARRGIAAASRVRVAGADRRPRPELHFASPDFLQQVRHEQRGRKRERDEDPQAEFGVLNCCEQLGSDHFIPPLWIDATAVPGLAELLKHIVPSEGRNMRPIARALLLSVIIIIVAFVAFAYWTGSASWRYPHGAGAPVGTTGT